MRRKILFILFVFVFSNRLTAQNKLPVYIFQLDNNSYRSFCGLDKAYESYKTIIFQFFEDSTFTLTSYNLNFSITSRKIKTIDTGRYTQQGDTLFLNNSISKAYPFIKEQNHFKELAKEGGLELFPAKIIFTQSGAQYFSYLNIPRKLRLVQYPYIAKLEMDYERGLRRNFLLKK
jgi:hypothetical protein